MDKRKRIVTIVVTLLTLTFFVSTAYAANGTCDKKRDRDFAVEPNHKYCTLDTEYIDDAATILDCDQDQLRQWLKDCDQDQLHKWLRDCDQDQLNLLIEDCDQDQLRQRLRDCDNDKLYQCLRTCDQDRICQRLCDEQNDCIYETKQQRKRLGHNR